MSRVLDNYLSIDPPPPFANYFTNWSTLEGELEGEGGHEVEGRLEVEAKYEVEALVKYLAIGGGKKKSSRVWLLILPIYRLGLFAKSIRHLVPIV